MRSLVGFIGLVCLALSSVVAADQCALINCDCANLERDDWRKSCRAQQKTLIKDCKSNQGQVTDYCAIQGPNAWPVALNLPAKQEHALLQSAEELKLARKNLSALYWTAKDDFDIIEELMDIENIDKRTIVVQKTLEATFGKVSELATQLIVSYEAIGKSKNADDVRKEVGKFFAKYGSSQESNAHQMWERFLTGKLVGRERLAARLIAMRSARSASNNYERAADNFDMIKDFERSASLWQDAAETSELLVGWQEDTKGKLKHITYYRNQAAARWYRAALSWNYINNSNESELALSEAEEMIAGRPISSVAER